MIKTVFVDYDNTLHDSDSKFHRILDGLFNLDGKTLWNIFLVKIHRGIVHKNYPGRDTNDDLHMRLLFKSLNIPYNESQAKDFIKRYYRAERECWENPKYFDDTFPFLNGLKKAGISICLTTGPNAKKKASSIEYFGSQRYFDHAFGEDNLGFSKTNPQYYRKALILSRSSPQKTVSIGDTVSHDVVPAKAVGIKTIWLNRNHFRKANGENVDFEVDNLLDALKIINSME